MLHIIVYAHDGNGILSFPSKPFLNLIKHSCSFIKQYLYIILEYKKVILQFIAVSLLLAQWLNHSETGVVRVGDN